jgi:POT family proton-dependent oligopeptide transporter
VFIAPTKLTQMLILGGALVAAVSMPFLQDSLLQLLVRIFLSIALAVAGVIAFFALGRGGLPAEAGQPKDPEAARRKLGGVLRADVAVFLGTMVAVAVFAFIVQKSTIASYTLYAVGAIALVYILYEAIARSGIIERQRLFVILILMFFSMLFWAFFEQAGSSLNNFADRNVDRVFEEKKVTDADVGTDIKLRIQPAPKEPDIAALPLLGQEQLGYVNAHASYLPLLEKAVRADAEKAIAAKETDEAKAKEREKTEKLVVKLNEDQRITMTALSALRSQAGNDKAAADDKVVTWTVAKEHVGMGLGMAEIPASEFQAANPIFILLFGLVFSALWTWLGSRKLEPSTTVKFSLGLLQLGLGFGVLWWGAKGADARGMTGMSWLLLAYLLHTTGELCISPVGLSMVSKLSPIRMVSTMMGAWFLATAFSQDLAAAIAGLTAVGGHGDEAALIPPPIETVAVYGDVFYKITIAGIIAAVVCFVLSPLLTKWMHQGEDAEPMKGGH